MTTKDAPKDTLRKEVTAALADALAGLLNLNLRIDPFSALSDYATLLAQERPHRLQTDRILTEVAPVFRAAALRLLDNPGFPVHKYPRLRNVAAPGVDDLGLIQDAAAALADYEKQSRQREPINASRVAAAGHEVNDGLRRLRGLVGRLRARNVPKVVASVGAFIESGEIVVQRMHRPIAQAHRRIVAEITEAVRCGFDTWTTIDEHRYEIESSDAATASRKWMSGDKVKNLGEKIVRDKGFKGRNWLIREIEEKCGQRPGTGTVDAAIKESDLLQRAKERWDEGRQKEQEERRSRVIAKKPSKLTAEDWADLHEEYRLRVVDRSENQEKKRKMEDLWMNDRAEAIAILQAAVDLEEDAKGGQLSGQRAGIPAEIR
jgi:hypothetical protein